MTRVGGGAEKEEVLDTVEKRGGEAGRERRTHSLEDGVREWKECVVRGDGGEGGNKN